MSDFDFGDLLFDLGRCRELLEGGEHREAFALAGELLQRAPENGEVFALFGETALAAEAPEVVPGAARRYLRKSPRDTGALEWLARAQWDLQLTEECLKTCRRILAIEPENYTALDYALSAALELGDLEDVSDLIDQAIRIYPEDGHLVYQAAVARMMRGAPGDEAGARRIFEEFLAREPDEVGTYINLMRIHHLAGRFAEVEHLWRSARARGLEHEDLHFNMGLALKVEGRDREAMRFFARALRYAAREGRELPEANYHIGQILRAAGHPLLALRMFQRELQVDDTQPAVHAEMAWCAEDLGLYEDAVRMARAAVERAPDWGIYRHSLSELLLKADPDSREAEGVALRATALDPGHAAGWQVLGRTAWRRGDLTRAEECLRRAVRGEGATAEDEGWLGLLLAERGRPEEARPLLERAARVYPFWDPVAEELVRILGRPLPYRYEVRLVQPDREGGGRYRVLHVVAADEAGARRFALGTASAGDRSGAVVDEVQVLGFEVDHAPGVLWDSGPSPRRYPVPPPPEDSSV